MGDYERSITVTADPDDVFSFVADVGNLPRYFPQMTSAEQTSEEEVHAVADLGERQAEGDAWFRADAGDRTVRWGSESDSGYAGEIHVDEDAAGAVVTLRLHTEHVEDEHIDLALTSSLDNIKQLVEAGPPA